MSECSELQGVCRGGVCKNSFNDIDVIVQMWTSVLSYKTYVMAVCVKTPLMTLMSLYRRERVLQGVCRGGVCENTLKWHWCHCTDVNECSELQGVCRGGVCENTFNDIDVAVQMWTSVLSYKASVVAVCVKTHSVDSPAHVLLAFSWMSANRSVLVCTHPFVRV